MTTADHAACFGRVVRWGPTRSARLPALTAFKMPCRTPTNTIPKQAAKSAKSACPSRRAGDSTAAAYDDLIGPPVGGQVWYQKVARGGHP